MKFAALFPGQGSQHPGMGKSLFEKSQTVRDLFAEASEALNQDMQKLCFEGSAEELALTENTQPALLLTSISAYQLFLESHPIDIVATAGHSVGEYAAAVASGVISFSDAIKAVRIRGQAMQSAVPVGEGGMVATMGLSNEEVLTLCQWGMEKSGFGPVEAANFNAPGQIVISGSQKALGWMQENYSTDIFEVPPRRSRLIPLKVSAPFHGSMMKPAQEVMQKVLSSVLFKDAKIPIVQNVDAQAHIQAETIRENLVQQVTAPVRWIECVETLREIGVNEVIEFGAGQVLTGLVKKIDKENLKTFNMSNIEELANFSQ